MVCGLFQELADIEKRKPADIEKTLLLLPMNCHTHNEMLSCLNMLDYSENAIPDGTCHVESKCVWTVK